MTRLCRCSECDYSDHENIDFASGKPYCTNWKQYIDGGCFYGSVDGYPDAKDNDIYYNPFFGDLWLVQDEHFVKIYNGYKVELDEPVGFIKVGHIPEEVTGLRFGEHL